MDKLDFEDVIRVVCDSISKNKRFSELSHLELCDLWKGVCKFLIEQLLLKKSINIHGIGSFYTKKTKRVTGDDIVWSVHFSPSKNWDKLPGYQIDRTITIGTLGFILGTAAAEALNLAAVAQQIGFTRDLVEAGIKDIVNGLTRILKRGSIVNLTMGVLGKMVFQNQDIKFRFAPNFLKTLNEEQKASKKPALNDKPSAENSKKDNAEDSQKILSKEDENLSEKKAVQFDSEKGERQLAKVNEDEENDEETMQMVSELDEAAQKLARLEELIDQTFSIEARTVSTHTHHHSGNRLWTDQKCPICKTKEINNFVDREAIRKAEKDHDKMLLHISLDTDKEYFNRKKELETLKLKDSLGTAQYNHMVALQSHDKSREKQPMGDLFEKRTIQKPIMSTSQMASGIHEQIYMKKEKLSKAAHQHAIQEKLISERLRKEIKAAELQAHCDKLQRCQKQRTSLAEQIRVHQDLREKKEPTTNENPFARSESLMALYQREKAKQMYYEQLAIVRQRQDYAQKVADIEKKHALNRLELSRKELEKDLVMIKKGKTDIRHSLETYWSDQIEWKNKLKKDFEVEAS
ncbi:Coiled-coil domain-containing protein 81 [Terramyces sp. JEL0728]|nr:Coiled-coil domain-containing protein 81 [Terramyces sp. JEL0728]